MPAAKPSFPILRRGHPLVQGMVGGWPVYEGSGLSLYDLSGNENNGALSSGVSWQGGQSGWCLQSDGTANGKVLLKTGTILSGLAAFTIAAWVKYTSTAAGPIYCERASSGADILKLDLSPVSSGKWGLTYRNDASSLLQKEATTATNDGVWHRILLTVNGVNLALYTDGKGDGTSASVPASHAQTNAGIEARLFSDAQDGTAHFNGQCDCVTIWNRALSADEAAWDAEDSWQQYRRRSWRLKAAGATFKAAWAQGSNNLLYGGAA